MKNYYDVSIIIPIFNQEKYIKKCIDSLIKQNYDFKKIEILLINDGSIDQSLNICKSYAKKYSNIKVYSHENHGVSYTRNIGLKHATGAYIMYLDSDDYLSNNTINSLVQFFDKHQDEIDILAYPLYNVYNGKSTPHIKNDIFKKTGVYKANDLFYFPMTTINVMIKNKKNKNVLFNENLSHHEDCNHNIKIVMQKKVFGYVKEASYYYVKHEESAMNNDEAVYFCSKDWLKIYQEYIKKYKNSSGYLERYIQMILLYEMNWKLKANNLFYTHLNDKANNDFKNKVISLLQFVETEVLLKCPHIDKFHKHFFLELKLSDYKVIAESNEVAVVADGRKIVSEKEFEIVFNTFKVLKENLVIVGFFKSVIFNYEKPDFFVELDGNEYKLDTNLSSFSNYKLRRTKTNNFYSFDIKFNINDINEMKFYVKFNNNKFNTKFYFMPHLVINKSLKRNYFLFKNNKIEVKDNKILVDRVTNDKLELLKKEEYEKYKNINKKINFFRYFAEKNKKDIIWLYNDKVGIIDNAFYQFKHDIMKKDGIKKYYILHEADFKFKNNFSKREWKYVVKFGSLKHKLLFLQSSKILTSFKNVELYSPFVKSLIWYQDLLDFEVIYLQHGILHCHTPWIYSKEVSNVDKVVISSKFEYDNFIKNYNYKADDLIMSGMPRFDAISKHKNANTKRFLLAPSWRINLMGEYKNGIYLPNNKKFLKSDFYSQYIKLLNSKKIHKLLKDNNIILDLSLHPIFSPYKKYFEINHPNINIVTEIDISNYDLYITDYSSFVFDYVYSNVDVLYFIPDYVLYKAGLVHMYNELDLPLEDGFGPLTKNSSELLKKIEYYIENNYSFGKKYDSKRSKFFLQKKNHCETLYNELIGDYCD